MGKLGVKHKSHRQWSKPKNPPICACGNPAPVAKSKPSRVTGEIRTYYASQCHRCYYRSHPELYEKSNQRHRDRYVPKQRAPRKGTWRERARREAGMRCTQCGFQADEMWQLDVDHIIPVSQGGTNAKENLQVLCANCHRYKTMWVDKQMKNAMPTTDKKVFNNIFRILR